MGDPEYFKQEYPASASEAFMFSGQSVFSPTTLAKMEAESRNPNWLGHIWLKNKEEDAEFTPPSVIELEEHERGNLKIWENPDKYAKYVIAADVAEGKAVEGVSEDKSKWDFSCAQVLKVTDFPPLKQVAVWHGNADPDQFGYTLVALARHYNNAYLAWEIRGPGYVLTDDIVRKCKYRYIHRREDMDSISRRKTLKPGWDTNSKTKPMMVGVGKGFVREADIIVRDMATLAEMKSFSQLGENKYGTARGHDDRVIALLIAITVIEPMIMQLKRKSEREQTKAETKPNRRDRNEDYWDPILGSEF
jgi:hypothetical protein